MSNEKIDRDRITVAGNERTIANPESQEVDMMAGLEKASSELSSNMQRLGELLESEVGIGSLQDENKGRFAEFREKFASHAERLKEVLLSEIGEKAELILGTGALVPVLGAALAGIGMGIDGVQFQNLKMALEGAGLETVALSTLAWIGARSKHI